MKLATSLIVLLLFLSEATCQKLISMQPDQNLLVSAYNSETPVFKLESEWSDQADGDKANPIQGFIEYGFGMWTRWSRTGPVYLRSQEPLHMIARLASSRPHGNSGKGDRVLAVLLARGNYLMATYTRNNNNLQASVSYGSRLDGSWNFLYFCYAKGQAKAYVWLNSQLFEEVTLEAEHEPAKYLEFSAQKEFSYPLFNGYYSSVQLRIGKDAFLTSRTAVQGLATVGLRLDDKLKLRNDHSAKLLLEAEEKEVSHNKKEFEPFVIDNDLEGRSEYAVSGWVRWVPPEQPQAWTLVIRASVLTEPSDTRNPGDRTLAIFKGISYYQFASYSCDQDGSECNPNVNRNIGFPERMERAWTFMYFGYSLAEKKAHIFVKYLTSEIHEDLSPLQHFYPTIFKIQLQKDDFYAGFNGFMKAWVANFGKGSFAQRGITNNINNGLVDFGYALGLKTQAGLIEWTDDAVVNQKTSNPQAAFIHEEQAVGILEFGFGFWSRFLWNNGDDSILAVKPQMMGVAKLTEGKQTVASVFLVKGSYEFQAFSGSSVASSRVKYDLLDSQWIYVYFCSRRQGVERKTDANMVGWLMAETIRKTEFDPSAMLFPLSGKVTLAVGAFGAGFSSFNGLLAKVRFVLGGGECFSAAELAKIVSEKPGVPTLLQVEKQIVKEPSEQKTETEIDDSEQQIEYSVSAWFRWDLGERIAVETIVLLAGRDRVLGLQQNREGRHAFSSYTLINDDPETVVQECQALTLPDQAQWVFSYIGFNKQLAYFLKPASGTSCSGRVSAVHRAQNRMKLFVCSEEGGKFPFRGKIAYATVKMGKGAFQENGLESSAEFVQGMTLKPVTFQWDSLSRQKILLKTDEPAQVMQELPEAEGHTTYGYGYWCQFMTAFPSRIVSPRPQWMAMSRLTSNSDHQDDARPGDRVLTIFLGRVGYIFSSYSMPKRGASSSVTVPFFGQELEGAWNFVYFCYDLGRQSAVAYVLFDSGRVVREALTGIVHRAATGSMKFVLGGEFSYPSFNGIVSGLAIRFEDAGFLPTTDSLNLLTKQLLPKPQRNEMPMRQKQLQDEESDCLNAISEELGDDNTSASEYAVFGWFKAAAKIVRLENKPSAMMLQLSNNRPSVNALHGSRTLAIWLGSQHYEVWTYSLELDNLIRRQIGLTKEFGRWTYFFVSYSFRQAELSGIIKCPLTRETFVLSSITHMVPGFLMFQTGAQFQGLMSHVGVNIGVSAFHRLSLQPTTTELLSLPFISAINPQPNFFWEAKPEQLKSPIDISFEEKDVSGATEYGWGVWSRWLMEFPTPIGKKDSCHALMRMAAAKGEGLSAPPESRLLQADLVKGAYRFTTYNRADGWKSDQIAYQDSLEGYWNYLYFSYYRSESFSQAKAFVLLGKSKSIESGTLQVTHLPLLDFLRVVAFGPDGGCLGFNGQLHDLQVHIGSGYIASTTDLKRSMLREPDDDDLRPSVLPLTKGVISEMENKAVATEKQAEFARQYSLLGWVNFGRVNGPQERLIARLTSNNPSKEFQQPGDRRLCVFLTQTTFVFSTYNFASSFYLERFNGLDDTASKSLGYDGAYRGRWNLVYFGYDFDAKEAFGLVSNEDAVLEAQFKDIQHTLPQKLFVLLGNDGILPQIDGWELHMGKGSFTKKPQNLVQQWPNSVQGLRLINNKILHAGKKHKQRLRKKGKKQSLKKKRVN